MLLGLDRHEHDAGDILLVHRGDRHRDARLGRDLHEAGEGRDPGLADRSVEAPAGNGDALELLPLDGEGFHAQGGQVEHEIHAGSVGGKEPHLGNILGPDRFGGHDPGGGESGSGGQKERNQTDDYDPAHVFLHE